MKASVIVPTFNRGYIIADTLQSVFAQTYLDFEVIVVDDGSKDDTAQVIARFNDPRLCYIRHEVNRGYSGACNTGIREARGEYISFLDSDDLWKPEKLARDVDFLNRHPEADAVFTDVEKEDGPIRTASSIRESPCMVSMLSARGWPKEAIFTQREMYLCLLQEVPVKPSAWTVRKVALDALEAYFLESWPSGSDWEILLRFSKRFRYGYIDEPLVVRRVQADSTYRIHALADKANLLRMFRREVVRASDPEIRQAAKVGHRDTALHYYWECLKRGQRLNGSVALTRSFLATGDLGLLARAAFALVRPKYPQQPH